MFGDTATTVRELIEHLKTFPPDAEVLYSCCSEWSPLATDEVTLTTAESRVIIWRPANGYSSFYEKVDYGPGGPDFRTCVCFPGN